MEEVEKEEGEEEEEEGGMSSQLSKVNWKGLLISVGCSAPPINLHLERRRLARTKWSVHSWARFMN